MVIPKQLKVSCNREADGDRGEVFEIDSEDAKIFGWGANDVSYENRVKPSLLA